MVSPATPRALPVAVVVAASATMTTMTTMIPPLCTVSIDPAPGHESLPRSIGVWTTDDGDNDDTNDTDDLPTVKAQGSDPQGTYSWTIVQGGDKIELLDAATGAAPDETATEVRIRGVLQSVQLNDVQIKVTHTTADGACSKDDMLELTAILATLTFRPANPNANPPEMWSPNNGLNAQLFSNFGAPQLGFVSLGTPPGTIGYFRNMEIRAEIQPCVPGLEMETEFDFKRDRQGMAGFLFADAQGNPELDPYPGDCPPPNWCDDDVDLMTGQVSNVDEDLDLVPTNDCDLFVIDAPGWITIGLSCLELGQPTDDGLMFNSLVNAMDFREWLNADGWRASGTSSWHAAVELSCANNSFIETNTPGYGNSLGQGALPCPENVSQSRPDTNRIDRVALMLQNIIPILHEWDDSPDVPSDASDREGVIRSLQRVARGESKRPGNGVLHLFGPRARAIALLGRLEAIETLVDLLDFAVLGLIPPQLEIRPAVLALNQIGEAAIPALLERVDTLDVGLWIGVKMTLQGLDHQSALVRQTMRTMLEAQRLLPLPAADEEKAQHELIERRLTGFLSTPEPSRPKAVPMAPLK